MACTLNADGGVGHVVVVDLARAEQVAARLEAGEREEELAESSQEAPGERGGPSRSLREAFARALAGARAALPGAEEREGGWEGSQISSSRFHIVSASVVC